MKRLFAVVVCVAFLTSAPAFGQEQFLGFGFSHFTTPEGVGTVTTVVAVFDPPIGFTYPLPLDFVTNEYTFVWQSSITSVAVGAFTTDYTYADASFAIYQDPSKNADYGTSPPNATSPSTFEDGTLILSGTISDVFRVDYNFDFPEPVVIGECVFTGGTRLGELPASGIWSFLSGLSSSPFLGIPAGYQRNWAIKLVLQEAVELEHSTWGGIKELFDTN